MLLINNKNPYDYYDLYASGYYVNIDRNDGTFYWDHEDNRFIISLNDYVAKKALKILKNEVDTNFYFGFNTRNSEVLDHLQDDNVKNKSWLNSKVREIYSEMLEEKLAFTMEAYFDTKLVGGLFGVPLGKSVTIDTMYGLPSPKEYRSASKALFCCAAIEFMNAGISMIDVETPHHENHPCYRLGEEEVTFSKFRKMLIKGREDDNAKINHHFSKIWNSQSSKSVEMYVSNSSSPA